MNHSPTPSYTFHRVVELFSGQQFLITSLRPEHAPLLVKALEKLSDESIVKRFLGKKEGFTEEELRHLTQCDGIQHVALGMALLHEDGSTGEPVAVARLFRPDSSSDLAEVAIAVSDDWQWQGLGRVLMRQLADESLKIGIRFWKAVYFSDNAPIKKILYSLAEPVSKQELSRDILETIWRLDSSPAITREMDQGP